MYISKNKKEYGLTLLEASIWFLILSVFLLGAFYLVHHIQGQRFVETIVDKNIRASSLRPFQLKGNSNLTINEEALNSYLVTLANTINIEINKEYNIKANRFIEVAYAIIPINTETGRAVSFGEIKSRQQIGSSNFISNELFQKTDLTHIIQSYVKGLTTSQDPFLYAIPLSVKKSVLDDLSASAGVAMNEKRYAPQAVFILARTFLSTENQSIKNFIYKKFNIESVYKAVKIVNLRGEYGL